MAAILNPVPAMRGLTRLQWAALVATILLALGWGAFVAVAGPSAALICAAAIVCVFTVRDFRVGVMMMIFIMPISASYIFPRAMFGVTGLNPLNTLLIGTFASFLMVAMPDGSIRRLMPWMVLSYVVPMVYAALNGMKNVALIPPDF